MNRRGFSLVELLIVVAIILVLAAILVPNVLRSKIRANEASAITSVRAINTAQVAYAVAYPTAGYSDDLAKLGSPAGGTPVDANHAGLLDWVLGCTKQPCQKSGYRFTIINANGNPVSSYGVTGVPVSIGVSGQNGYCSDHNNPLLADPNGGTTCTQAVQ